MVKQYPYTGKVVKPGNSVKVNGQWAETGSSVIFETTCRPEPARASQYIKGVDGQQITFSSIVYMPKTSALLRPGMLFEVWDGEKLIVRETVKQFSLGQLNARVWL